VGADDVVGEEGYWVEREGERVLVRRMSSGCCWVCERVAWGKGWEFGMGWDG